jgi:hypothetical protein
LAIQFPGGSAFSSSPHQVHQFLKLEGNDDRVTASTLGAAGIDQVNEIIANPVVNLQIVDSAGLLEDIVCPVAPSVGGDQSMHGSFLCTKGCNACNPCPYCEVSLADMCCTDLQKVKGFQERSQERVELLAHSRCGTCPGCGKLITEGKEAREGDAEPTMPKGSTSTWIKAHLGIVYGSSYIIQLPVKKWIICILHANLIQTAALWSKTLRKYIGQFTDSKKYTHKGVF